MTDHQYRRVVKDVKHIENNIMLSIQTVSDGGAKPQFYELRQRFVKKFGLYPKVIVEVPGRVNIIGEHIDYCGYGVLPMAIEPSILVAVGMVSHKLSMIYMFIFYPVLVTGMSHFII